MGDLKLNGATSGTITLTPTAVAGTNTITLPASTGTVALTASPTFSGTLTATTITSPASTALTFQYGGTTGATLDTSGNLLVGTTSAGGTTAPLLSLKKSGGTTWQAGPAGAGAGNLFYVLNSSDVGVYLSSGNTSWTANSDERLKTDLVPITDGAEKVSSLRAVTGRFKTDKEGTSRSFLIAQDVQKVLPEAVDASNPDKLGVQYTDVIPLLVAAIQELSAKNDALEARLAALEAK